MRDRIADTLMAVGLVAAVIVAVAWMYLIWTFDWGTSYRGRGLWLMLMLMLFGAPIAGLIVVGLFTLVATKINPDV